MIRVTDTLSISYPSGAAIPEAIAAGHVATATERAAIAVARACAAGDAARLDQILGVLESLAGGYAVREWPPEARP